MNILYTVNDNFIPQIAASITSICENNKKVQKICFFIMSLNIAEENKEKLNTYVHSYSVENCERTIIFIELDNISEYFDFQIDTTAWNPIVLARLLAGRLLPKEIHRVIYLDGDTIVRKELRALWETEMGNHAIGACMEPTCSLKRKEEMGLKSLPYHNAGVLLIDLDNWRKNGTEKEIMDYYSANEGKLYANDQDAINGSQRERILTLSFTYNYHNTYDIYPYRLLEKVCDYSIQSREEAEGIKKNPCIIHYLGEERPWRIGNKHRFCDEYIRYLNMTPWAGQNLESGWGLYFWCWNLFNFIMKPFPMLRLHIMNTLIPMVIKWRGQHK